MVVSGISYREKNDGSIFCVDWTWLQTTHVAAQYGQTAFLYHIVSKWNADPDAPDNDGRSPLHWYMGTFPTPLCQIFLHC